MDIAAWTLEFHSGIPAYKQIINRVQAGVAAGELSPGDQLPTIRAVHRQVGVNPNTVARAYRELETAGVISTQQGSGCFVAPPTKQPPLLSPQERKAKIGELTARLVSEARSFQIPVHLLLERLQHDATKLAQH